MEDATIDNQQTEEPLYQKGRFPSIIDTDDLVFEMGKQAVQILNSEKLLDRSIKQIGTIKQVNAQLNAANMDLKQKAVALDESNRLYQKNNQILDAELVSIRSNVRELAKEMAQQEVAHETALQALSTEFKAKEAEYKQIIEGLKKKGKPTKPRKAK
jgi:hypothetical protein